MVLNASNVTYAKTGESFYSTAESDTVFDFDTAIPTTGWYSLGYQNADGWTDSDTATSTVERAWQNSDSVREFVSEGESTITTNLYETKKEVIELIYNTTVDAEGGYNIDPNAGLIRRSIVANITDGERAWRLWIPSATVKLSGDVQHTSTAGTFYPITITAYKKVIAGTTYGPKKVIRPYLVTP